MNATVIGSQLGDEGKGAVVDLLATNADIVVRFQGGDNAGHTVTHGQEEYPLRLLPSGVVGETTIILEGDSMRIPLKNLERKVRHGVPKVDL